MGRHARSRPTKLALQFRIYSDAQGEKRAYFDSLSQKVGGLKVKYREEGTKVFLDCDTINAKFEGEKSDDERRLVVSLPKVIPSAFDDAASYGHVFKSR